MIKTYKDLIVWQKSIDLSVKIYKMLSLLPKEELFGLSSQMKRSVVSISSNIAEGRHRNTKKEFVQFLKISMGSSAELQSQLEICKRLSFINELDYNEYDKTIDEIMRMLNSMILKLKADTSKL
jgi:four helix bundle protein